VATAATAAAFQYSRYLRGSLFHAGLKAVATYSALWLHRRAEERKERKREGERGRLPCFEKASFLHLEI